MLIRRSSQIAGVLFLFVGLLGVLTGDILLGAVWALLGLSMLLGNPFRDEKLSGRSPRTIAATVALIVALVLLVIDFA